MLIYPHDLEAWERKAGSTVSAGDVICLRTGSRARQLKVGPWNGDASKQVAGLAPSCIPWSKQRDVALLSHDGWQEAKGSGVLHQVLPILGLHTVDDAELEAVGEFATSRRRWEFLLTMAPLRMPRATGSPVKPVATF
jgi:kynurenine formamidase